MARRVPLTGGEKDSLQASLNRHRDVVLWKIEGVAKEALRRPMTPSGTSLLGLVNTWQLSSTGGSVKRSGDISSRCRSTTQAPPTSESSSSAVVACGAVDELAQDVEMPGVASGLLDHVDEDPP